MAKQKPYTLSGDIQVTEGYANSEFQKKDQTEQADWLLQKKTKPLFYLNTAVDLQNPFIIENEVIYALLTGNIQLQGTNDAPIATGTLNFVPGGVFRFRGTRILKFHQETLLINKNLSQNLISISLEKLILKKFKKIIQSNIALQPISLVMLITFN